MVRLPQLLFATVGVLAAAAPPSNICGTNATLGRQVMSVLNLTWPGLEAVAAAEKAGDLNGACEALAAYYVQANTSWWLRVPPVQPGKGMVGGQTDQMVLHDIFFLSGVDTTAKVPRNADGGLDWLDKGPTNDVEFMNCLNRHDSFVETLNAWRATGNPIYSNYFNALITDWTSHLPCPDAQSGGAPCVPLGLAGTPCQWGPDDLPGKQACQTGTMESPWRSLEMGIRMGDQWPTAFFGFQGAAEFSTSARVLMVLAVGEHNAALAVDGGHPGRGTPNWEMTQWQGLVTSCVAFPELLNTTGLLALAVAELDALLQDGVYPDGVETEMASGYDMGTAGDFYGTLQLLADAGLPPPSAAFRSHVEQMWDYGSYISDPAGCLPRNGDSDLCGSGYLGSVTQYFGRPDWTYVRTNGAQGTLPPTFKTQGPSSVFPWSGQIALRSAYSANATWAWFDVGPYGSSGHAHRDKLTLNVHARGSMLLVDSGRFAYQGTDLSNTLHREYAAFSRAHNTWTIDGCDQLPLPALASAPIPNASWSVSPTNDTAYGSMSQYDGLAGNATHTRAVYFQRTAAQASGSSAAADDDGDWIVVVDRLESDRPRQIQATWHAHPNATGIAFNASTGVAVVGGVRGATGQPTSAQICVIPAPAGPASSSWASVSLVRGVQADPAAGTPWQGWYSQVYDDAWPAPTLEYNATGVPAQAVFVWLLVPTSARGPCDAAVEVISAAPAEVVVAVTVAGVHSVVTVPTAAAAGGV